MRTLLPERKIAAQDNEAGGRKGIRDGMQQARLAVGSGAMR
jgi:hypothetical protein